MTDIPLFPLSTTLMPHGLMALQIFEQRYLDLVSHCLKTGTGFGVVWMRRGVEVAGDGINSPDLGDYGTYGRIVDFDQLSNGLLGITVQGCERFDIADVWRESNGLIRAEVEMGERFTVEPMLDQWHSLTRVLKSLQAHPHVQRMNLDIDYNDAWQVAFTLVQLLPFEEYIKYELLGLQSVDRLVGELDSLLNQISGEDLTQAKADIRLRSHFNK